MTKHISRKLTISCVIVISILFLNQAVFAQTGPAGSHDEIVKRLQDKLAAIGNEVLTGEITPILNDAGEADLGAKLVESFLGSVEKINKAIAGCSVSQNATLDEIAALMTAVEQLQVFLDEIDQKANLIQTYYDALPPNARNRWSGTASARMTNGSRQTVNALQALNLIRPANVIANHPRMCFVTYEQVKQQLDNTQNLAAQFENAAAKSTQKPQSGYPDYDEPRYDDMSYDDMPDKEGEAPKQEKLPDLTLIQQAEALAMGTASVEQILPLCRILASSMDSLQESKRFELTQLRQPAARPDTRDMYDDYAGGPGMYDMPGRASSAAPSFRSAAMTMPSVQPNVANLMNMQIRYFMVRTLKPMVLAADEKNKDVLFKAWCALGEGGAFTDPIGILEKMDPQVDAMAVDSTNYDKNAVSRFELMSVLSDYRSDIRVLYNAGGCVTQNRDLSIQMCFNLGNTVLPLIKLGLTNPHLPSPAKVAQIEATQYIGDPDAAAFLIPLLLSNDQAIVRAAADAIGAVGDSRASATLIKGLKNPKLADTIIDILKKMGSDSQNDIIAMFKEGNPTVDKFCLDILRDGGDINALPALAAVLRRYHNSPSMKDLPQAEKSEMLMLAMQAGIAIISRNMNKKPPELVVPTLVFDKDDKGNEVIRLDYGLGAAAGFPDMRDGMGMGMDGMDFDGMSSDYYDTMLSPDSPGRPAPPPSTPPGMSSSMSPGSDGTNGNTTMAQLNQLTLQPEEIKNNAPYAWLEMVYIVAAKHLADSAKLMEDVRTVNSGRKIGTTIREERVDREFFRKVINTSEEGLSAYMIDSDGKVRRSDVRKLKEQKDRVIRSLGVYKRQENLMSNASRNAFNKAVTGVDPNATGTSTDGTGTGTTQQPSNPLGRRL